MWRNITIILLTVTLSLGKLHGQYEIMFSNSYPPFNYSDENGKLVGFNIDILNAISNLYDTNIIITGGDWNEINKALNEGNIHAIGGAHFPGRHDNKFLYARSTINTSHCFFYNTKYISNFSLKEFRTLKEPLIALWPNDVLVRYVLSINPSAKFLNMDSYEDLLNAIDREDVTCIFGQRIGSKYYAKKLGKDYIMPLEQRILERNMGFKVSNSFPELADLLNNGLEVLLANGEYQRIYDKWITEYNTPPTWWKLYIRQILIIGILIITTILVLIIFNRVLRSRVRSKTKDLQHQLDVNSQIMNELEKQKIKAEESDKMKSAFLANMSHEIRTPINGILGFTSLLKSADYSPDKQTHFIEIIQQSGNRMLDTINNIIDASKLESGLEEVQIKEVNIASIIDELLNFFSPEAVSKGLELSVTEKVLTNTQPFFTDEYKLNSILTNLIKNAIKFTSEGKIQIKYSVGNEEAEFWVIDTGIGIATNKQSTVFDQFVQADYSYSSGYEGSGLGLSISKGYINLLKGSIKLESEPNIGSSFYFNIPNDNSNNVVPTINDQVVTKEKIIQSKYNILIAEDDETSYEYLALILAGIAKNIFHAKNGIEAIEMTKKYDDIDFILMDIKMPKLSGFDATREIRKFNSKVYIIAQSAYTQESYKLKILEAGCNDYISKPIDQNKLLEMISLAGDK